MGREPRQQQGRVSALAYVDVKWSARSDRELFERLSPQTNILLSLAQALMAKLMFMLAAADRRTLPTPRLAFLCLGKPA